MTGYQLSPRAAALERQWSAARSESKAIVSGFVDGTASTANRDDFETNRVTTARFYDSMASGDGNVEGLATAGACVSFWAGNIAGLPLHIVREVDGIDEVYTDHRRGGGGGVACRRLHRRPPRRARYRRRQTGGGGAVR